MKTRPDSWANPLPFSVPSRCTLNMLILGNKEFKFEFEVWPGLRKVPHHGDQTGQLRKALTWGVDKIFWTIVRLVSS
jgi:hypothetical protein